MYSSKLSPSGMDLRGSLLDWASGFLVSAIPPRPTCGGPFIERALEAGTNDGLGANAVADAAREAITRDF